ncbi:hypothetical protein BDQ17DRAFT_1372849 [Cyathus striatus]|nr:hypothetical protein BDQ17DRAFT_1372849 [Cyathus striatus]
MVYSWKVISSNDAHRAHTTLPKTFRAKESTLIILTSGLSLVPLPTAPHYCATQAALYSFIVGSRVRVVEVYTPLWNDRKTVKVLDAASLEKLEGLVGMLWGEGEGGVGTG